MLHATTQVLSVIDEAQRWVTVTDPVLRDTRSRVLQVTPRLSSRCLPQVTVTDGAKEALVFPWGLTVTSDTSLLIRCSSRWARENGLEIVDGVRSDLCWAKADYWGLPPEFEMLRWMGTRPVKKQEVTVVEAHPGPWVGLKVNTGLVVVQGGSGQTTWVGGE